MKWSLLKQEINSGILQRERVEYGGKERNIEVCRQDNLRTTLIFIETMVWKNVFQQSNVPVAEYQSYTELHKFIQLLSNA